MVINEMVFCEKYGEKLGKKEMFCANCGAKTYYGREKRVKVLNSIGLKSLFITTATFCFLILAYYVYPIDYI